MRRSKKSAEAVVVESVVMEAPKAEPKAPRKARKAAAPVAEPVEAAAPRKARKAAKKAEPEAPVAAPVAPKVSGIVGPIHSEGETYFNPTDLARLESLQLRARNAEQAVELASTKILAFQQEAALKIQVSKEEAQKLVREFEAQRDGLVDFYRKLESVYGIDMKSVAYDAVTGRINRLPMKAE